MPVSLRVPLAVAKANPTAKAKAEVSLGRPVALHHQALQWLKNPEKDSMQAYRSWLSHYYTCTVMYHFLQPSKRARTSRLGLGKKQGRIVTIKELNLGYQQCMRRVYSK